MEGAGAGEKARWRLQYFQWERTIDCLIVVKRLHEGRLSEEDFEVSKEELVREALTNNHTVQIAAANVAAARAQARIVGVAREKAIVEGFRAALLGSRDMPFDMLAVGAMTMLLILFTGVVVFNRMERNFVDVI